MNVFEYAIVASLYPVVEMYRKFQTFIVKAWYKFRFKYQIVIPWPDGDASADPNEYYRAWLEAEAGEQGWGWQWDIEHIVDSDNGIRVMFHEQQHAVMFALLYGK